MIQLSELKLPGYKNIKSSPLPKLRYKEEHQKIETDINMPLHLKEGFGKYTGFRVLPYKMQNHYHRSNESVTLKTITYENDYLKAIFLPEYGGRLYSLYHKEKKRELLYTNPVFQPANLSIRNAWFSGGIEWNIGHFGHTFLTCEPVFFAKCLNEKNEEFLRMYEYERVKKLFYQIDFYLPPNSDSLVTYTKIINPYNEPTSLYYWSNTAVSELKKSRVFSSTDKVVYVKPYVNTEGKMVNTFGYGQLPELEGIDGDVSYPRSFSRSNEYFFQTERETDYPWEAVGYEDGFVFYECSTRPLNYRKMFCWGTHLGGSKWQDYLSHQYEDKYVEIQAGIFPTQLHSESLASQSNVGFMQIFGAFEVTDTSKLYEDLEKSSNYVKTELFKKHNEESICKLETLMISQLEKPVDIILHNGSGWGSLELIKREHEYQPLHLPGFSFPITTLTKEQDYWRSLLEVESSKEEPKGLSLMLDSFMVDLSWLPIIEHAIMSRGIHERDIIHKALIFSENQQTQKALQLLHVHEEEYPSFLYQHIIGAHYKKLEDYDKAKGYYVKAYDLLQKEERSDNTDINQALVYDFLVEYLDLLNELEEYQSIWNIYTIRKNNEQKITEEMKDYIGEAAYQLQQWDFLNSLFEIRPERIREGNNNLCELWFKKKAYDLNIKDITYVRENYMPPKNIDFRMN